MTRVRYAHEFGPGDAHEPLEFRATPELNQQFLYALEDFDPQYWNEDALVHPVLLLHMSARTRSPSFRLAPDMGSIFARDRAEFLDPARVGRPLVVNWRVLDVYEKRGRAYQCMGVSIHDADGTPVLRREMHSTFFRRNGAGA